MIILIVDDSGVMRRIHKNTLVDNGVPEAALIEAEDGVQALERANDLDVNLFLVDWNMPKMDGLSFVKKLRAMDKYSKTPIIMVTSEAAKYNVIQAISSGVTDYVVKPIKGDILWSKISSYIYKA